MDVSKISTIVKQAKLNNQIEVEAESLEDALKKGAEMLGTSIINLDYEVIQRGKKGFLGLKKAQNFIINVWKSGELDVSQLGKSNIQNLRSQEESDITIPRNGEAKIKVKKGGISIKITPPKNNGNPVEMKEVENMLLRRGVHNFNKDKIGKLVKKAEDKWIKIGEWIPNPEYDSQVNISISGDEMQVNATMSAPIYSGRTLEPDEIVSVLEAQGVKFGINYEKIKEMCEEEIINIPVLVAEGKAPQHGLDSRVNYRFRTGLEGSLFKAGEKSRVDFKDLNKVQNVLAGQVLAEKLPAEKGIPGRTVLNKLIEARDGRQIPLRLGKNTRLSEDGLKVYSQKDGQVFLSGGEITVREIFEVRGDVDYNIGNIDFVGSVVVHGHVKEGFRIRAQGDVSITGIAQRCEILAEGKVVCKGGVIGGKIKSNQSIAARYIDAAEIFANVDVIVREEIINSNVSAGGRVICLTGKGGIIGGKIVAGLLIVAKRLGSDGYTPTILEAGIDPNIKKKLEQAKVEKEKLEKNYEQLVKTLQSIEDERDAKGLSPKKEAIYKKMELAKKEYIKGVALADDKIRKLSQYLTNIENKGTISAKYVAYPGIRMRIKNAEMDIKFEYKGTSFKYANGNIKPDKYEALDIERDVKKEKG